MKPDWRKWGMAFWASVARHVGTAGLSWGGLNVAHNAGVGVPVVDWKGLCVMLVCGGIMPAVFTFLQETPVPEDLDAPAPATEKGDHEKTTVG